jgi:hypothetical protein
MCFQISYDFCKGIYVIMAMDVLIVYHSTQVRRTYF